MPRFSMSVPKRVGPNRCATATTEFAGLSLGQERSLAPVHQRGRSRQRYLRTTAASLVPDAARLFVPKPPCKAHRLVGRSTSTACQGFFFWLQPPGGAVDARCRLTAHQKQPNLPARLHPSPISAASVRSWFLSRQRRHSPRYGSEFRLVPPLTSG